MSPLHYFTWAVRKAVLSVDSISILLNMVTHRSQSATTVVMYATEKLPAGTYHNRLLLAMTLKMGTQQLKPRTSIDEEHSMRTYDESWWPRISYIILFGAAALAIPTLCLPNSTVRNPVGASFFIVMGW
ncbi:hypothetical protein EDC04DRAFT_2604887 [Pisolithus marmoratus]|nr:hypothetical protein EDC04DRAFT_2604887 [Pisolithus marmoratus]